MQLLRTSRRNLTFFLLLAAGRAVHKMIIEAGAYPSPLNYGREDRGGSAGMLLLLRCPGAALRV